jgi:hypothetical protein
MKRRFRDRSVIEVRWVGELRHSEGRDHANDDPLDRGERCFDGEEVAN